MKVFLPLLFVTISLFSSHALFASADGCHCKDCRCTKASHCGCFSNQRCTCQDGRSKKACCKSGCESEGAEDNKLDQ